MPEQHLYGAEIRLDMVVAHKVEIEGDSPGDMSPLEQSTTCRWLSPRAL